MLGDASLGRHLLVGLTLGLEIFDGGDVRRRTLGNVEQGDAQLSCSFLELFLDLVHVGQSIEARHSLDTTQICTDTALRHDFHEANLGGVGNVAAAAQLARELASLNDAHGIAVFLAKQSRDARLASSIERSLIRAHGNGVHDLLVCDALDLSQLLGRYALEVGEVETQAIGSDVAASLLHMVAQNLAQRCMEQMRAGMVARNALAAKLVDNRTNGVAHMKLAFDDFHVVAGKALFGGFRIDDFSLEAFALDNAGVAHFAAHFGVERSQA